MTGVPTVISFFGVEAVYHDEERRLMRELVEAGAASNELLTIHQIIAEFGATLVEDECRASAADSSAAAMTPADDGRGSSSTSVPTGHGQFQIPERVQGELALRGVTGQPKEREGQ